MASGTNLDQLIVQMSADIKNFERGLARANNASNRQFNAIEKRAQNFERRLARSSQDAANKLVSPLAGAIQTIQRQTDAAFSRMDAVMMRSGNIMGRGLAAPLAALAGGVSVQQVGSLADSYTRFSNALRIAGLEGEGFRQVEESLFQSANRNGVEIESLGQLFSRTSGAAKELGVSLSDITVLSDAAANSIKVQGTTTEAASGALLQLSQALGSPIVRAEEFNSILEGLRPLAQAAANGIDRFGGSVGKLREAIADGDVTNIEFFQGILKSAPALAEQAARANLTLSNSFKVLNNQLVRGIGNVDASLGATEKISASILYFSNNLDKVGVALGIVGAALAGKYVSGISKAGLTQAKFISAVVQGNAVLLDGAKASALRATAEAKNSRANVEAIRSRIAALKQEQLQYQQNIALANAQRVQAAAAVVGSQGAGGLGQGFARQATEERKNAARALLETNKALRGVNSELIAQEGLLASASTRLVAAENAKAAAISRTTLAARAGALAQKGYAAASSFFGGPVGLAVTALAATFLVVSANTAQAEAASQRYAEALRLLKGEADAAGNAASNASQKFAEIEKNRLGQQISQDLEAADEVSRELFYSIGRVENALIKIGEPNKTSGLIDGLRRVRDGSDETAESILETQNALNKFANSRPGFQSLANSLNPILEKLAGIRASIASTRKALIGLSGAIAGANEIGGEAEAQANLQTGENLIKERNRRIGLSDRDRSIEDRRRDILKQAKDQKAFLSESRAQQQAIIEIDKEFADREAKSAERASRRKGRSGGGGSGGGGGGKEDSFQSTIEQIKKRTEATKAETAALSQLDPLVNDYGFALEKVRQEQDLLNAAQEAGVAVTPALRAEIAGLATAYAQASVDAQKLNLSQDEIRRKAEEAAQFQKDLARGIADGFLEGKDAAEIFANALDKIKTKLLDLAFDNLFGKQGEAGGGLLGKLFSGLGSGKGGLFGGAIIPGILHNGGVAGQSGYGHGRAFPASTWSGAPRYHKGGIAGLKNNEVPAILERGERVIPRNINPSSMARRRAAGLTFAPSTSVVVQGNADERTAVMIASAVQASEKRQAKALQNQWRQNG